MTTLQHLPATTVSCSTSGVRGPTTVTMPLPDLLDDGSTSRPLITAQTPTETAEIELSRWDIVDEWGSQSFPASDPPSNW